MRVGSFVSGQQAANPESPQHSLATPAPIVEHLSNQNSQRNIFHSECHRGVELVYIIHTDKKPLEYRDASCQATP